MAAGKTVREAITDLKSPTLRLRNQAAVHLGVCELRGAEKEDAIVGLIAALADRTATVRRSAASALGFHPDVRAVEPLIGLLADKQEAVRTYAAQTLGEIGDRRAIEPLRRLARDPVVLRAIRRCSGEAD